MFYNTLTETLVVLCRRFNSVTSSLVFTPFVGTSLVEVSVSVDGSLVLVVGFWETGSRVLYSSDTFVDMEWLPSASLFESFVAFVRFTYPVVKPYLRLDQFLSVLLSGMVDTWMSYVALILEGTSLEVEREGDLLFVGQNGCRFARPVFSVAGIVDYSVECSDDLDLFVAVSSVVLSALMRDGDDIACFESVVLSAAEAAVGDGSDDGVPSLASDFDI